MLNKNSNVLILNHFFVRTVASGPAQDLRDFLLEKVNSVVHIEHPFPYNGKLGEDTRSALSIYEQGELKRQFYFPHWRGPDVSFYIKDFLATQYFLMKSGRCFDLCVALDNLNTISVLPWRKLGVIKKLVYYTIDYNPQRFASHLLNSLYHLVDKICCYQVDAIWNLAERMMEGRSQKGIDIRKTAPSILVPMGVHLSRIKILPVDKIQRHTIVYLGTLSESYGIQLVLKVLPDIRRSHPDIKFIIIGKGDNEGTLKTMARQLGLEDCVEFKGFIKDNQDVENILCQCAIGIATYISTGENFVYYTDPGKPKQYLGCGLPVVITRVPAIAGDIEKAGAGVVVEYNEESLKQALIKLLTNDDFYRDCRQKAIEFSKSFDMGHILENALHKTFESSSHQGG